MNGYEIVVGKVFGGLILPRRMERYVYGVSPYFKRGNNIRTQRIAYHQQLLRLYFQAIAQTTRSEEHTSELQSRQYLVCRLLLEKKKKISNNAPDDVYSAS